MKQRLLASLAVLFLLSSVFLAHAPAGETNWPARAVSVVVGASPGGGTDAAARLYAKYLQKYLGKSFPVVNMAGGGASIASNHVLKSAADGYTVLVINENIQANKLVGVTDYSYEAFDFGGLALVSKSVALLTTPDKFKSLREVIDKAKAEPGSIITGTEMGGATHQLLIKFEKALGISLQIVDGGSVGVRIGSLLGGHLDLTVMPLGNCKDYVATGDFLPLVMFNGERVEKFKDYPAITEFGADVITMKFFGLFFNKGTDPAIVAKMRAAVKRMSEDPEFIAEADKMDCIVEYHDSQEYLAKVYDVLKGE